jgi:protein gp37
MTRIEWCDRVDLIEARLELPLCWKKPAKIFVSSMSDLFHEALPDADIDRIFDVMRRAPQSASGAIRSANSIVIDAARQRSLKSPM